MNRRDKPGCLSLIFQEYSSPGLVKNSHCQQVPRAKHLLTSVLAIWLPHKDDKNTILFGVHAQVSFGFWFFGFFGSSVFRWKSKSGKKSRKKPRIPPGRGIKSGIFSTFSKEGALIELWCAFLCGNTFGADSLTRPP